MEVPFKNSFVIAMAAPNASKRSFLLNPHLLGSCLDEKVRHTSARNRLPCH
jgi:hypothetical protein